MGAGILSEHFGPSPHKGEPGERIVLWRGDPTAALADAGSVNSAWSDTGHQSRQNRPSQQWDETLGYDGVVRACTVGEPLTSRDADRLAELMRLQRSLVQTEEFVMHDDAGLASECDGLAMLQGEPEYWRGTAQSDQDIARASARGVVVGAGAIWSYMTSAETMRASGQNALAVWRGLQSFGIAATLVNAYVTKTHNGVFAAMVDLTRCSLPVINAHLSPGWGRRIGFGLAEYAHHHTGIAASAGGYGIAVGSTRVAGVMRALKMPYSLVIQDAGANLCDRLREALKGVAQ